MSGHWFISYSTREPEAKAFAIGLADALLGGDPSIRVWIDRKDIRAGADWMEAIGEALEQCIGLLLVVSHDSVRSTICKAEVSRAARRHKHLVPLMYEPGIDPPIQMELSQQLQVAGPFDVALARVRSEIAVLSGPRGELLTLQRRRDAADRDLLALHGADGDDPRRRRILTEVEQLDKDITHYQWVVDNPEEAKQQQRNRIERAIEQQRKPKDPVSGRGGPSKFINRPPADVPESFQGRAAETLQIGRFLQDETTRLLCIAGRAGMGKTALACRVLKSLESGRLPDDGGPCPVDGIVYESGLSDRALDADHLILDLLKLVPTESREGLASRFKDASLGAAGKVNLLLDALPTGRIAVLLDNFEDMLDTETRNLKSHHPDLFAAICALVSSPGHGVQVILTTRVPPDDVMLEAGERGRHLDLDNGLRAKESAELLRSLDPQEQFGLLSASDAPLSRAHELTRGNPRALVAIYAVLSADRESTLNELLGQLSDAVGRAAGLKAAGDTQKTAGYKPAPPDNTRRVDRVLDAIVGTAFQRLDIPAQRVMQALAIYARAVPAEAIDWLLEPYVDGLNAVRILNRLFHMKLVHHESGGYGQHPVDREYALSRLALDGFDAAELRRRGADWFVECRLPREDWKAIDDLTPQLDEFELRYAAGDFDAAAAIVSEIDYDYLLLWGHADKVLDLRERLDGRLEDPRQGHLNAGRRGSALYYTGRVRESITFWEIALQLAREREDRESEGVWFGNLGIAYAVLGATQQAIEITDSAIATAREIGNRRGEGHYLSNRATLYSDRGETRRAIEMHEQAIEIAREIGDRRGEGVRIGNLAMRFAELGQTQRAIEMHERALHIAQEIRDRLGEGGHLGNLGRAYSDLGEAQRAIKMHERAIDVADEIRRTDVQSESRTELARLLLTAGETNSSATYAQRAVTFDVPEQNAAARRVLGLVRLTDAETDAAREAFETSRDAAQTLIDRCDGNFRAWDELGLALCGLVGLGERDRLESACDAFRTSRAINRDAGYLRRLAVDFDLLLAAVTDREIRTDLQTARNLACEES